MADEIAHQVSSIMTDVCGICELFIRHLRPGRSPAGMVLGKAILMGISLSDDVWVDQLTWGVFHPNLAVTEHWD